MLFLVGQVYSIFLVVTPVDITPIIYTDPNGYTQEVGSGGGADTGLLNYWFPIYSFTIINWNNVYYYEGQVYYGSIQDAAIAFGVYYNPTSDKESIEYGASIVSVEISGRTVYNFGDICKGYEDNVWTLFFVMFADNVVGTVHTHGGLNPRYDYSNFSSQDKMFLFVGKTYVITPAGELIMWDRATQSRLLVYSQIPVR